MNGSQPYLHVPITFFHSFLAATVGLLLVIVSPACTSAESGVRLEVIQPDRSVESMLTNAYGQPHQVYSRDLLLLEYEYDGSFLTVARARFYFKNTGQSGDYKFTITLLGGKETVSQEQSFRVEGGKKYAIETPIYFGNSANVRPGIRDYTVRWASTEKLMGEVSFTVPAWDPEIKPLAIIPLEADSNTAEKD